jgi:glycosyltransferase involved in cell wall biosynthesis
VCLRPIEDERDLQSRTFSPQAAPERKGGESLIGPAGDARRSLAGITILQLVPALRDDPPGRGAVDIALAVLQSGARAIVAGDNGPLAGELRAAGCEWLPMRTDTFDPLRIQFNARRLAKLIASERVDIVHAQSAGAAWSATAAIDRMPVFLVTSFPDRLPADFWPLTGFHASLARGDRVIAPSSYVSRAMIERYKIAPDRVSVIPRAIDTAKFSPAAVSADRVVTLRRTWGLPPQTHVVLVPGRIAPWNGQLSMIDAAPLIAGKGGADIALVFAGEDGGQRRYAKSLDRQARMHGIDALCRIVGPCSDLPAALAAADVVVVPALEPPLTGRMAALAQAMGRPVVTTEVGVLPETVLCPPRMRDDVRTGWLVPPGSAGELARAVASALALDVTSYKALSARARQFAVFAFSPPSVAEAIRGVYTSLLARDV